MIWPAWLSCSESGIRGCQTTIRRFRTASFERALRSTADGPAAYRDQLVERSGPTHPEVAVTPEMNPQFHGTWMYRLPFPMEWRIALWSIIGCDLGGHCP